MTNLLFLRFTSATILAASVLVSACRGKSPSTQIVDIKTSDSVVLKGTLFAAAKPGPAVLLLHQCDAQRKVWDSLGVKLMNAGISALSVDYRGFGESGGAPFGKLTPAEMTRMQTEKWPADIDSAYAFLLAQPNVDARKIGIAGGSCGADNAVQLALRHKGIKALALLAGGLTTNSRKYIAAADAPPVFVGAAADDKYMNFVDIMSWYFALSPNKQSRSITYHDGGHAALVFEKHPDFADSVSKWYSAVLLNTPALLPSTNGTPMNADVVKIINELDQPSGAESVSQKLAEARKQNPHAQLFPEFYANQLGYEHMQANDNVGAIAIMKLNTVAYPDSPNAMDSLGDVYLAAGDKKSALETAKQTLIRLKTDSTDTAERKKALQDAAEGKIKQLSKP